MILDSPEGHKFTWGDTIKVIKNAPDKYHPLEIGFVCGMMDIDSEDAATAYDCVGSNWLYTIEWLDGSSMQIPEKYLEKDFELSGAVLFCLEMT